MTASISLIMRTDFPSCPLWHLINRRIQNSHIPASWTRWLLTFKEPRRVKQNTLRFCVGPVVFAVTFEWASFMVAVSLPVFGLLMGEMSVCINPPPLIPQKSKITSPRPNVVVTTAEHFIQSTERTAESFIIFTDDVLLSLFGCFSKDFWDKNDLGVIQQIT